MTANQHSLSDQTRPDKTTLHWKTKRERKTLDRSAASPATRTPGVSQTQSQSQSQSQRKQDAAGDVPLFYLVDRSPLAARLAPGGDHDQYLLNTCNAATLRILQTTWVHHRSTLHSLTNRLKTRYCSSRSPTLLPILRILSRLPRAPRNRTWHPNNLRLHSPDTPSSLDNLSIFTVLIVVIYSFPIGFATLDASHPIELLLCSSAPLLRASQFPWHESPPPCFADTCLGAPFPLVDVSDK
jgi:hypothetical protein